MLKYAETESLLLIALSLSPNSIKAISEATNIKVSTLYKWKTTDVHLSPKKSDALLSYFQEQEPLVLLVAEIVRTVLVLLFIDSSSFSDEEVTIGG